MATLLDGKRIQAEILAECEPRIQRLLAAGHTPGLAVVLAGEHPASQIYVGSKVKTTAALGMRSFEYRPPASITTEDLLTLVRELNERSDVDGILVQMPLPPQVDARQVLLAIDPAKDVDGFHPENVGRLVANLPGPRACTPAGVIELLRRYGLPIAGQRAVVVGRSDIVGKPMALLLLHENATVTITHSKTPDLAAVCREADILVAALGRPAFVTREFIKPGAVVVDVGINRLNDTEENRRLLADAPTKLATLRNKGSVIVGDVHPEQALELASAYTPVPGGVGLLTIALLMRNTVECAERRQACSASA